MIKALRSIALLLTLVPAAALAQTPASTPTPPFKRIMIVVLENTGYDAALRQPFLASLARRGALLTHYTGVGHPSQPNYLGLVAGSTLDVHTDRNVTLAARHVGDLLDAKGLGWKVYAEGYPGNCFLGRRRGVYVRKHVPFLSFEDVQSSPARCAHIVDASELAHDVRAGTLPAYSLYIPDERHDGHDTGVAYADRWLSRTFGPLLRNPRFTKGLLFVVTFDESPRLTLDSLPNHVLTVLVGGSVTPGARSGKAYDHYSLLRLVEDRFGLGNLGRKDATAMPITGIWR